MVDVSYPSTMVALEVDGVVTDCKRALAAADVAEDISAEQTDTGVTIAFDVRDDTGAATPDAEENERIARRIAASWGFE